MPELNYDKSDYKDLEDAVAILHRLGLAEYKENKDSGAWRVLYHAEEALKDANYKGLCYLMGKEE